MMKEIEKIEKKIKTVQQEIDQLAKEIAEDKKSLTPKNMTNAYDKMAVCYGNLYFDWDTGLAIDDITDYKVVYSHTLKSNIAVILGFDLTNAAIIYGFYSIVINNSTMKMKKKFLRNSVYNFFDLRKKFSRYDDNSRLDCKEFIRKFFDCNYNGSLTLYELSVASVNEGAFEIIIRSELNDDMKDYLLRELYNNGHSILRYKDIDKSSYYVPAMPIHKILGLKKDTYKKIKEASLLDYYCGSFIETNARIGNSGNIYYELYIPNSDNEFIEALEYCKTKEKELDSLGIKLGGWKKNLYSQFSYEYKEKELNENYTFNKLIKYVVEESINQGYEYINEFIKELNDYIRMCKTAGMKPNLYSSYLKQIHDLASRNYSIIIDTKSEEIFKLRYEKYSDVKINEEYYVITPKSSQDLKKEGSNLGHCVASYINSVIEGRTLIFFLRKDKDESLVTFEYNNGRIIQARGARNRRVTEKENAAIYCWLRRQKKVEE